MNKFIVTGRLTRDPQTKEVGEAGIMTTISVAVDRGYKDKSGEYKTDFFNFSEFDDKSKYMRDNLKKGDLVEVEAVAQNHKYEVDGKTIHTIQFKFPRVRRLSKGESSRVETLDLVESEDVAF